MKTTVIYHKADYDGIFCREAAKHFLGTDNVEYIGWDFCDAPLPVPSAGRIYVLDLPVDRTFGFTFNKPETMLAIFGDVHGMKEFDRRLIWIDHHKSSIESHPNEIKGYRIDGVAACRLAWQWFSMCQGIGQTIPAAIMFPSKDIYLARQVNEPFAVTLAGEYDIWDHRGDGSFEFQFGLDSQAEINWELLFNTEAQGMTYTLSLVSDGSKAMKCYATRDAAVVRERSFLQDFEGLRFLALNTPRCNSQTFAARDIPSTGHDALMAFFWNGKQWIFSLYHAAHRKDLDLSVIAKKMGGGGHRGACGFQVNKLPF